MAVTNTVFNPKSTWRIYANWVDDHWLDIVLVSCYDAQIDVVRLNMACNISKEQKKSCFLYFSTCDIHTHIPLSFDRAFLLLLLSQALIIESQVKITSSSHTWLGQKQLLQRSNVFFTRLFTLIRQCAAMRNALDSKWQSFALNKERGALGTLPAWIILELEVNHTALWVSFAVCYSQHTCDLNMFSSTVLYHVYHMNLFFFSNNRFLFFLCNHNTMFYWLSCFYFN